MDTWVPDSRLRRLDASREDAHWIATQWEHPQARIVGITREGLVLVDPERGGILWLRPQGRFDPETVLCIGTVGGVPYFAMVVGDEFPAATLRELASQLSDTHRDVATTAVALVNWHKVAPFCGICGGQTEVRSGGHVRWCSHCERDRYPRTDPAVIVAILDHHDRLLLGHQAIWDAGRVSLLAGFVESGESLEQALRREVREEAEIELGALRYFGSQPHPFPRSLMLAFVARATTTDVCVDGRELQWAGFFDTEEVRRKVEAGSLRLPAQSSIASRMIGLWLDGNLPAPEAS